MKQLIFPLFLSLLMFSCSKEELNQAAQSSDDVQIEFSESGPPIAVTEWQTCCPGEECSRREIEGSGLIVHFSNTTMANNLPQDLAIFIRPVGSTGSYYYIASSSSFSYPAIFDFNLFLVPGCYEVRVVNDSANPTGPGDTEDGGFDPDLIFCCGSGGGEDPGF